MCTYNRIGTIQRKKITTTILFSKNSCEIYNCLSLIRAEQEDISCTFQKPTVLNPYEILKSMQLCHLKYLYLFYSLEK